VSRKAVFGRLFKHCQQVADIVITSSSRGPIKFFAKEKVQMSDREAQANFADNMRM